VHEVRQQVSKDPEGHHPGAALVTWFSNARAYGLVRDYFDVLFHEVEQNGGVIVKTIGDSVMASFKSPSSGVATAGMQ
jgi:hypothetical protein